MSFSSIFPSKLMSPFWLLFAWITFEYILFVIANASNTTKSVLFIFLDLISIHIDIIATIIIKNINISGDCFPADGHIPFKMLSFCSSLFVFSSLLSLFLSVFSLFSSWFLSVFSVSFVLSFFCSLSFLIFMSICLELNVVISAFCSSFTVFKFLISIFVSVLSSSLLHNSLIFSIS